MVDKLIGKKFKRDVYGLSLWEDTIEKIEYRYSLVVKPKNKAKSIPEIMSTYISFGRKYGYKVEIIIKGKTTHNWYDLKEIVILW